MGLREALPRTNSSPNIGVNSCKPLNNCCTYSKDPRIPLNPDLVQGCCYGQVGPQRFAITKPNSLAEFFIPVTRPSQDSKPAQNYFPMAFQKSQSKNSCWWDSSIHVHMRRAAYTFIPHLLILSLDASFPKQANQQTKPIEGHFYFVMWFY